MEIGEMEMGLRAVSEEEETTVGVGVGMGGEA